MAHDFACKVQCVTPWFRLIKFESDFYAKPEAPSPQAVPAAGEPTISMTAFTTHFKAITAYAGDSHEKADRAKTVH